MRVFCKYLLVGQNLKIFNHQYGVKTGYTNET